MRSELAWNPLASVARHSIPKRGERDRSERRAGTAETTEDGERVLRQGLVDELGGCLDSSVQPLGKRSRLLFGAGADEDVLVPAYHAVTFALEPIGELGGCPRRLCIDADLPRREPVFAEFLLRLVLLRRLVVPALLLCEPVLDAAHTRGDI